MSQRIGTLNMLLITSILSLFTASQVQSAHDETANNTEVTQLQVGDGPRHYKINTYDSGFPPWDIGTLDYELKQRTSTGFAGAGLEILTRVCEANKAMTCSIIHDAYQRCLDVDSNSKQIVGDALKSGEFDGCHLWFQTAERLGLGVEYSNGWSTGPRTTLIRSTLFKTTGSKSIGKPDPSDGRIDLYGAHVLFYEAFWTNESCLNKVYKNFTSEVIAYGKAIPLLEQGKADYVFWFNDQALFFPNTTTVGEPILDCHIGLPGSLGLSVFPSREDGKQIQADQLRRDYNCGLALIREEIPALCKSILKAHGRDPLCVSLVDLPKPTAACLNDQKEVIKKGYK